MAAWLAAAAAARQAGTAAGWRVALCASRLACHPRPLVLDTEAALGLSSAWLRGISAGPWASQLLTSCPPAGAIPAHRPSPQHSHHFGQQPWHCLRQQSAAAMPPLSLSLHLYSTQQRQAAGGDDEAKQQQLQQQQQPAQGHQRQQHADRPAGRKGAASALQAAGWSRREVVNVPNALSMLRLLSGPVIASWILDAQWALALPALAISGATDWADGYTARRFNQPSVIGSYLDPLADKVLICSVVGALGWSGVLPGPVVAIVVGRDVLLVAGAFAARAKSLGWRWPGWSEFFRVAPGAAGAAGAGPAAAAAAAAAAGLGAKGPAVAGSEAAAAASKPAAAAAGATGGPGPGSPSSPSSPSSSTSNGAAAPAPLVQPLFVSKVNTVFQLGLVGTCILQSWQGWPGEGAVLAGSVLTAGTTVWSCWAYLQAYRQGKVLAPATAPAAAPAAPPPHT